MKNDNPREPLIAEIRKRFDVAQQAVEKQHKLSMEDMKFCSTEHQWSEEIKIARAGKPTYASDRINSQVKNLVNAQRENRPAVSIHVCNDGANEDVAEVLQGIVRHIEVESDADLAYDQAFEDTVRCGFGFWRILTEYEEGGFDQTIKIESIINPFQVYLDPNFKKLDGSDIEYAFVVENLTEDEFKAQYPKADLTGFNSSTWLGLNNRIPQWFSNNGKFCTVAEYFCKEFETKTIVKLSDGRIMDKKDLTDEEKPMIVLERDTREPIVKWYKLNGVEILEETTWPGSRIPIIPVFGDALLEEGQRIYSGLVRKVKEEQQMLNIVKTTAIELIAMTPKAPWIGPKGFTGDSKNDWADANTAPKAYLEYEITNDLGEPMPPPTRNVQGPDLGPVLEIMQTLEMDIKSTNNMYDPSMGQKVSDQSGVAVKALQNAGSMTNYHFSDNLSRAIRLEGRILLDLIPKVYSEKRVIRIVGLDDKHRLVTINGQGTPDETGCETISGVTKVFDVTTGKYDVTVSAGPSYQTKRQENQAMLFDLAGKDPALMGIAGDLIVSQMDSPIAIQLRKRLEKALPPGLLDDPNDPNRDLPPAIAQRLQHDQQLIQQLTQTLQQETELADKEQNKIKLQTNIAQIEQQTALLKQQSEQHHDANLLAMKTQLQEVHMKHQQSHEILSSLQKHLLKKEEIDHKAHADMAVEAVGHLLPPPPVPSPTLQAPTATAPIAPPK